MVVRKDRERTNFTKIHLSEFYVDTVFCIITFLKILLQQTF